MGLKYAWIIKQRLPVGNRKTATCYTWGAAYREEWVCQRMTTDRVWRVFFSEVVTDDAQSLGDNSMDGAVPRTVQGGYVGGGGEKRVGGVVWRIWGGVLVLCKGRKWQKGPSARRPVEWSWGLEVLRSCVCPVLCPGTSPAPVAPGRKPREVDAAVRPGVHISSGVRTRRLVLNFQCICQMSYRRSEKIDPPPHSQPRSAPIPLGQETQDATKLLFAQNFSFCSSHNDLV